MTEIFREPNIKKLNQDNFNDVYQIFKTVYDSTPYGFLTYKSVDDIRALLLDVETNFSYGYFKDGELLGYQLAVIDEIDSTFLQSFHYFSELHITKTLKGRGVLVKSTASGTGVGLKLVKARGDAFYHKNISSFTGLIDVNNMSALRLQVYAGQILIGFERDKTSLNYQAVLLKKTPQVCKNNTIVAEIENLEQHKQLFAHNYIATGIVGKSQLIFNKLDDIT